MQTLQHASPTLPAGLPAGLLAPGSWLADSGLNGAELALAGIHRRSAERIVEILFRLKGLPARFRDGVESLLNQPMDREYEMYLAGSTDCFDLERRMRAWDHRPKLRY